ncbi:MAG: class II fructose-bisphosphate aldolase [Deltaproteobacteria bacterium]|nr:class II fructose-bisphosphate aldolase [Deltaproteobacteria bacterium]
MNSSAVIAHSLEGHCGIDEWVYQAVFQTDPSLKQLARRKIREMAKTQGIVSKSIGPLYKARGEGNCQGFTVPAFNIRGLTYDVARAVFRAAKSAQARAFIFEIARSEISYTDQSPDEYAVCVLAAAIKEDFGGTIFLQGDHFQFRLSAYQKDPEGEIQAIRNLIKEAIEAEFYNVDIDASTLVDLSKPTIREQQELNATLTAEMTRCVRSLEPEGMSLSVGGEIGEVGGRNSTVEELRAFLDLYREKMGDSARGLSKVSVQTGTTHGGVPLPDGRIAKVMLDFDVLARLSSVARDHYGLSGAVQHGASTLPEEAFDRFPKIETAEIHLATGFQNMIYESPHLPLDFLERVYGVLRERCKEEWKEEQTEEQFFYKTRKKAFGFLKKDFWDLPESVREPIGKELEEKFRFLFEKLQVTETEELVNEWIG